MNHIFRKVLARRANGWDRRRSRSSPRRKTLLIISQVYIPDPAAVGQYMHDAAQEVASRGTRVVVFTSGRGYNNPSRKYARREFRDGVEIRRFPLASFGKRSIPIRLAGAISFLVQAVFRACLLRRIDGLLISTSPPMCSLAALMIRVLRRVPVAYWVMDINPDQTVALGKARPKGLTTRLFDALNRAILSCATRTVTLDRFMASRLRQKRRRMATPEVIPPWPLVASHRRIEPNASPFRHRYGLTGRFVLMYSGNMSPAHPLDAIIEAMGRLRDFDDLVLVLAGDGSEKQRIEAMVRRLELNNVRFAPYQPLELLSHSLAAADVHVVSVGQAMVGIVHPCKVYGAMAVARPILLLGPRVSHVGEIVDRYGIGWRASHGDVEATAAIISRIRNTEAHVLREMGERARAAVESDYGRRASCRRLCDVIKICIEGSPPPSEVIEGDPGLSVGSRQPLSPPA